MHLAHCSPEKGKLLRPMKPSMKDSRVLRSEEFVPLPNVLYKYEVIQGCLAHAEMGYIRVGMVRSEQTQSRACSFGLKSRLQHGSRDAFAAVPKSHALTRESRRERENGFGITYCLLYMANRLLQPFGQ